MTLVVVLYLEQIIQKLKVFGGPFGLSEVMPRSHSRSVCDKLVSFFFFCDLVLFQFR